MKQKFFASALSIFALAASGAWIPLKDAHALTFNPPPDNAAPKKATGGASRGSLFVPKKGEAAPRKATGGASRNGSLFIPRTGESAPKTTAGGSSRNGDSIFAPRSGESAPIRTAGGSSRGDSFVPRSGESAPKKTAGGSSRDGQAYLNIPGGSSEKPAAIVALLPQTYFGTTVSQNPEVLIYLPSSSAKEGIFSIKDIEGNTLHEMSISVSGKAEVISINVPVNLKFEKNYQWFLALNIDKKLSPRTPYIDGWIKRIKPNQEIINSMQEKDLLKRAEVLGKNGVWYDCIATLAKLRTSQPGNQKLDKHWEELLASVGLNQIEKAPLVAFN